MKKFLFLSGMLLLPFFGLAQVSKQQAINLVLSSIVNTDADRVNVYMDPLLKSDSYYKTSKYDSIYSPITNYWLFFIDDMPEYAWDHDCRYVFVNSSDGNISIVNNHTPPYQYKSYFEVVSEPVVFSPPPIYTGMVNHNQVNYDYPCNDGKYALLFSGGETGGSEHSAFWNALCHSYCGLLENGFKKENVFVLSCDGGMANPSLDLDKDGQPDINYSCSLHNIEMIVDSLSIMMQEGDILYVYGTMHGGLDGNNAFLYLWDSEKLYDFHLANILSRINCSQFIVNLWACYSGGMSDEIISMNNNAYKTVLTCTGNTVVWRQHDFINYSGMDIYNYFMNSALRNSHPVYPDEIWRKGTPIGELQDFSLFSLLQGVEPIDINYDTPTNGGNNNGFLDIGEAINYTAHFETSQFGNIGTKHYECGFDTRDDLLSLKGVSGTVKKNQTVSGSFHVEDVLSIRSDALTLAEGTKLYLFDADLVVEEGSLLQLYDAASIVARSGECRVIVRGSLQLGSNVTFEARAGASLEIIYQNDSDVSISNATFINCTLVFPPRNIAINDCYFVGTPVSAQINSLQNIGNETISVVNCSFVPNGQTLANAIYVKGYSRFTINGCTIDHPDGEGSYGNGIYIQRSGNAIIRSVVSNNEIANCTNAGLQLYASTGNITMNRIHDNGYGVKLLNNSNISDFSGRWGALSQNYTQHIYNNVHNEVYMTGNSIPEQFKYNVITDDDNIALLYHDAFASFGITGDSLYRDAIDVTCNYWGSNFNSTIHLFTNLGDIYQYLPKWTLGVCGGNGNTRREMMKLADSLAVLGNYFAAKSIYKQVVEEYPTTVSAETALKSMLTLERQLNGDYETLQNYYLEDEVIMSKKILKHLASFLANKCNEEMEHYEEAIAWYEAVLNNPETTFVDSVFAAIDLGDLYLAMEDEGDKGVYGKLMEYKPSSLLSHQQQTETALALLPVAIDNYSLLDETPFPVSNLEASVVGDDTVALNWDIPINATKAVISWSNMIGENEYGIAAGQCATEQAARFSTDDLSDFVGWTVDEVSVILSYADTISSTQDQNYFIRIWKGTDDALEQVYEKEIIHPVYSVPLGVSIDTVIYIENGKDFWVGYYIDKYEMYPWVIDNTPVAWGGNGFCYRFHHENSYNECVPIHPWDNYWPYSLGNLCVSATLTNNSENGTYASRLTGYRIYRDGQLVKEIPYSFLTYYTDTEFTKAVDLEYCVTAVYGDEESEPICTTATITGISESESNGRLVLSPNPTTGLVRIEGADVAEVWVYNVFGQLVKTVRGANVVHLDHLPDGVFLFRILLTDGATHFNKVLMGR